MKIICPTCDTHGTIKKRFVTLECASINDKKPDWLIRHGRYDNFLAHQIIREPGKDETFTIYTWPRIKCKTCDGDGWVERVDSFQQLDASLSVKQ